MHRHYYVEIQERPFLNLKFSNAKRQTYNVTKTVIAAYLVYALLYDEISNIHDGIS